MAIISAKPLIEFPARACRTEMISVTKAAGIIDGESKALPPRTVAIEESIGRTLAEPIIADSDLPPFDRSQMDGYAVIAAETSSPPVKLKIVGESAAGRGWHSAMESGEAVRIMTGAPVPEGSDAVQKVELTEESDDNVILFEPTETGRYIIKKGSEIKEGSAVLKAGTRVDTNKIATLAAFGYANVKVGASPRVAIIGTGSEIVGIGEVPGRDQIRNSNSVMLAALSRKFGASPTILPNVRDEIPDLETQVSRAAAEFDVVVLTGGVSVGKYDHTKTALNRLGAEIHFEKIRLKPGKPAVFATLGDSLIFGLPGNPVSAAVTFHLFVRRALLNLQGACEVDATAGFAVLGGNAKAARERDTYLPSRVETNRTGQAVIQPLRWSGSSDFVGYAGANSLIWLSKGTAAAAGDVVEFVYL